MNCVVEGDYEGDSWYMQSNKANQNKSSDQFQNKVLANLREFSSQDQKSDLLGVQKSLINVKEEAFFKNGIPKRFSSLKEESTPKFNSVKNGVDRIKFIQVSDKGENHNVENHQLDEDDENLLNESIGSSSISQPSQFDEDQEEEEELHNQQNNQALVQDFI